jgi:hypothetical protein
MMAVPVNNELVYSFTPAGWERVADMLCIYMQKAPFVYYEGGRQR